MDDIEVCRYRPPGLSGPVHRVPTWRWTRILRVLLMYWKDLREECPYPHGVRMGTLLITIKTNVLPLCSDIFRFISTRLVFNRFRVNVSSHLSFSNGLEYTTWTSMYQLCTLMLEEHFSIFFSPSRFILGSTPDIRGILLICGDGVKGGTKQRLNVTYVLGFIVKTHKIVGSVWLWYLCKTIRSTYDLLLCLLKIKKQILPVCVSSKR